jgi:membrane protease YdiL (CAAX protease family)
MTSRKHFYLFLCTIPVLAAAAGLCNNAGVKTHFYLWELLLDGKTIVLAGLFFAFLRPTEWKTEARSRGVFAWSLLKAVGSFMIPVLISGVVVGVGVLLKKVSFADPENGATLLLTMIFDIPAVFIFSVTTVFVEEYIFRGVVLTEFLQDGKRTTGLVVSSLLWAAYAIVEVLPLDEFSWAGAGLLILYYIAVGCAASGLYSMTRSLWVSYAFRIGVMTVTPSLLQGVTGATDAFFTTENYFFYGDGITTSLILLLVFVSIYYVSTRGAAGRAKLAHA